MPYNSLGSLCCHRADTGFCRLPDAGAARSGGKCVRVIRSGDKAYLVSLRGPYGAWFRNIRAEPKVKLRMRGGTYDGLAREITDPIEYKEAEAVYCDTINPFDRAAYVMHRGGNPTRERVRDMNEHWFKVGTPLMIELLPKLSQGYQ